MAREVTIEGLDDVVRKLKMLPGRVQRKALTSGLRKGAWIFARDARQRAPKDTGRLRRNIVVRKARKNSAGERVEVFVRRKGKKDDPKNAFYWTFLEFGTRFIPARPFFRPAFEANKVSVAKEVPDAMAPAVQREIDKLGK